MPAAAFVLIVLVVASVALAVLIAVFRQFDVQRHPEQAPLPAEAYMQAGASMAIAQSLSRGDRIAAIKAYRAEHSAGLREGADAVDRLAMRAWKLSQPVSQ